MNPHRLRAYSQLLVVSVIWGVAAVVIKYTLSGFPPFVFLTYRFFLSTVLACILFIFTGIRLPKDKKTLILLFLYGFLVSTVALGLLFLGTDKTTSIDANLISAMAPITIVIAGAVFLKERVTKREKIGIGIALTGTLITIIEPILRIGDGQGGFEGNLLVFASILVGTITAILAKVILRRNVEPVTLTNISFIVGFATTLPIVLVTTSPAQLVNSILQTPFSYHLGVIYMAVLSGTFAYILWHKAEKTIEVSEVSLFAYLYPVFGIPLSIAWLKETVTLPFILGAIIIGIGILIAETKKKRYN